MKDLLTLEKIHSKNKAILQNISLNLSANTVTILKGENGTGKTTLLNIIAGSEKNFTGKMKWYKQCKISLLPQLHNLHCHFPVTLGELSELKQSAKFHSKYLLTKKQQLLSWNEASGGERVRTLLLRSLQDSPDVLLLDEPFNHVDSQTKVLMEEMFKSFLTEKSERAIVFVGHNTEIQKSFLGLETREIELV